MTNQSEMNHDPPLSDECQRALEAWVCEDPDRASAAHIASCETCAGLAEAISFDRDILRWQLSRIEPPPPPVLPLREPLRSASWHPRRVSLTVIPFLLAVLLVVLLAVQYMLGTIGQENRARKIRETRTTLEQVENAAARVLAPPTSSTDRAPEDWAGRLAPSLGSTARSESSTPAEKSGAVPTDAFGREIRLLPSPGATHWIAVSAGPDGVFEADAASSDDVVIDEEAAD